MFCNIVAPFQDKLHETLLYAAILEMNRPCKFVFAAEIVTKS